LFGSDADDNQGAYKKPSQAYSPPAPTYQEPTSYAPPAQSYQEPASYAPSYGQSQGYGGYSAPVSNENNNPYTTSSNSAYSGYVSKPSTQVTTFGSAKAMRSEHNLGGDGSERSSVKVHHPPGGGGSLNIFGGASEPTYELPRKKAPVYEQPSYDAPSYNQYSAPQEAAGGYSSYAQDNYNQPPSYASSAQDNYNQPPSYGYSGEEYKQPSYEYNAPPSGFTSGSSYSKPQSIQPSNLTMTSQPQTFGQRVESGSNSGPTTDKSSIRVHAPPGGKSNIFF